MRKGLWIAFWCALCVTTVHGQSRKAARQTYQAPIAAPKKVAKNAILLIADGMGMPQISSGFYTNGNQLQLQRFPFTGMQKPHAHNSLVTDAAAAATAIACGVKTNLGFIGLNPQSKPVKNLLEEARERGLATGLITTGELTEATPGAFVAHLPTPDVPNSIAKAYLDHPLNFFIGGGKKHFIQEQDNAKGLTSALQEKGYQVSDYDPIEVSRITFDFRKNFAAFSNRSGEIAEPNYYLPALSLGSMFLKNRSRQGFVLVVHSSDIHQSSLKGDTKTMAAAMQVFDRLAGALLDFAAQDGETLVIVTGTHESGGLAINPGSQMGDLLTKYSSPTPTGAMLPVLAFGPGAELFSGAYENAGIHTRLRRALGWP